ncbi:hypothetical protein [uncultured Marinobacter sp.]|uniref:hypothetical protein n=1 Tax=uncultured Marinobacter sp. TaxID=187379 RepID=UPI00261FF99B|nr:hypothetical protein [uncultured Marinobacter sp.]
MPYSKVPASALANVTKVKPSTALSWSGMERDMSNHGKLSHPFVLSIKNFQTQVVKVQKPSGTTLPTARPVSSSAFAALRFSAFWQAE